MAAATDSISPKSLLYMINHLFLPPQLPQEHDYSQTCVQSFLTFVTRALRDFESHSNAQGGTITKAATDMITTFAELHIIGESQVAVQPDELARKLQVLCRQGGCLLLQISSQNAGILINRVETDVHFELFELTPSNHSILETKGRLVRQFPGQAIAVPVSSLQQDDVMKSLASSVSTMSTQSTTLSQPTSRKAGSEIVEVRHSVNPCIVTDYLSSILLAHGSTVEVRAINKKMREEVMYTSCLIPWTRSQTWLLFRVGLQLTMSRLQGELHRSGNFAGAAVYKEFIVYLMAALLREAHKGGIESDLLSVMTSKVSWRLRKIGGIASSWLLQYADSIIEKTTKGLEGRWAVICKNDTHNPNYAAHRNLNFHKDTIASIPNLDAYIMSLTQLDLQKPIATFAPSFRLYKLSPDKLPSVHVDANDYRPFHLAGLESWVEDSLNRWLARNISDLHTCKKIWHLLDKYHAAASVAYQNNPEAISLMILTCLELWIACNKSALMICPELGRYHYASVQPGLIRDLLQSLILPRKSQLERLNQVEEYLSLCLRNSSAVAPSIFDSFGNRDSFYVRYFQSSEQQQELYNRIESEARQARQQKEAELATKKEQHEILKNQANGMCCNYHYVARGEENVLEARNAVFELAPPSWFPAWRDATAFLLLRVLSLSYTFGMRSQQQTIKIGSIKHDSDVLVDHGLRYEYFNSHAGVFTSSAALTDVIPRQCMLKLPSKDSAMQPFLYRPASDPSGPPPNAVIASQYGCPQHMTVAEFKELCVLPLGFKLQWQNILRQLQAPSVNFNEESTFVFIAQCITQAGWPDSGNVLRASHAILADPIFAQELLDGVLTATSRAAESWQSAEALRTFILIATRASQLTTDTSIARGYLDFLALAASQFLQCLLIAREGIESGGSVDFKEALFWQSQRVSHRAFPILLRFVTDGSPALDEAIRSSWSGHAAQESWAAVSDQLPEWLVGTGCDVNSPVVRFNLLTGELLVNGLPLTRLPPEYECHATYKTLFGTSIVDVMPGRVPGFPFSTNVPFSGYDVQFALVSSKLYVRASKDRHILHFVPGGLLRGFFPDAFVDNYVHFYHEPTTNLIFHSLEDPWVTPHNSWVLLHVAASDQWQLQKDDTTIISLGTPTSKTMAKILGTLEDEVRIHCFVSDNHKRLDIELPQLRSRFLLQAGDSAVASRDFRGMVIDEDQNVGTLVGLFNKLVLKDPSSLSDRIVLLLGGQPQVEKTSTHVSVQIIKTLSTSLYAYRVDTLLGRLVDGGGLQSKLFLSLLHSLTAFCIPDQLTSRTGTEEALRILRSAAVRSANGLTKEAIGTLEIIAGLTPKREFYPKHLRDMQTMHFDRRLGFMAQHDDFVGQVQILLGQATENNFFHEGHPEINSSGLYSGINTELLARHKIRVSQFRVSTFGAEDRSTAHDVFYNARDVPRNSATATVAYKVADTIQCSRVNPSLALTSDLPAKIWTFLQRSLVSGTWTGFGMQIPSYDAKWFKPWHKDTGTHAFIAENWLKLHDLLSQPEIQKEPFAVITWLAAISCAEHANTDIVHVLTTFFTSSSKMRQVGLPPSTTQFDLSHGYTFRPGDISKILCEHRRDFNPSTDIIETQEQREPQEKYHKRGRREWLKRADKAAQALVEHFRQQWPRAVPVGPTGRDRNDAYEYFRMKKGGVMSQVCAMFRVWYENLQFFKYLQQVCAIVSRETCPVVQPTHQALVVAPLVPSVSRGFVSISGLFSQAAPSMSMPAPTRLPQMLSLSPSASTRTRAHSQLKKLVDSLKVMAKSPYENDYVADLEASRAALEGGQFTPKMFAVEDAHLRAVLVSRLASCQQHVNHLYHNIRRVMTDGVADTYQLPRISPMLLLEQLRRDKWPLLGDDWKRVLIEYAVALTSLQRAQRLVNARGTTLVKELQNDGHGNWDPSKHPEWLLLEIEGAILIRDVQVDIATNMQNPADGRNAVMQLNMGEGKSSVIVPMLITSLADGDKLMRVLVAKPQSKQMAHMLISKLGGLVDRQVFHLPFSRAIKVGQSEISAIQKLLNRCRDEGGVLLVQPEHILSFQLMGIEHKVSQKSWTADRLLQLHEFMRRHSRDVVDESDENFSPRFELVYSLGQQQPIDHSPERWACIQEVLDMVRKCLPEVQHDFPNGVGVRPGPKGCFPHARLVEPRAADKLLDMLADRVCQDGIKGFPITQASLSLRDAVHEYIRNPAASGNIISRVEQVRPAGFWADNTKNTLLLLRGLIANGILAFAFGQKRWRVDYGLDTTRAPPTSLAVPYRAKDHPSARSEFSHPDIVIVLTSLSYYYQGLNDDQVSHALSHLDRSDQRADEYATWVKDANKLPNALQHLGGVNLEDTDLCVNKLFPCFRHSKAAIDYFLAHIVFTKELKEFPYRLSASGWDIGEQKAYPTTGFSGTNDAQIVLPLGVKQMALPAQAHTNALVLQHLLRPETAVKLIPSLRLAAGSTHSSTSTDAEQLLNMVVVMSPPVRVILDVGAQIIELDNLGVAKKWLNLLAHESGIEAAVFVDTDDNICVVDRKDRVEPLYTSPYCTRLSLCVVFLDDAHTRGTDLKLPEDYRAAVTLGANLAKDRLVQACMRMRELGRGQSVVFCVPEEIHRKINQLMGRNNVAQQVSVSDVLAWSISETWHDARRNVALWANQGKQHESHSQLWARARGEGVVGAALHPQQPLDLNFTEDLAKEFLEDEAQLLETRYRPASQPDTAASGQNPLSETQRLISQRCQNLDATGPSSAILQEEQERELAPEVEEERQPERPAKAEPLQHAVHPDVVAFVRTGLFPAESSTFIPVYKSLANSSAGEYIAKLRHRQGRVHCTRDFQATIKPPTVGYESDSYQRPVQWVLTSSNAFTEVSPELSDVEEQAGCGDKRRRTLKHMVIISPYEAQHLMDAIRQSRAVALHLYAPLLNEGFRSLDKLDLYTVPSSLSMTKPLPDIPMEVTLELDLFAGQLYFKSYAEFEALRVYLLDRSVAAFDGQAGGSESRLLDENLVGLLNIIMTRIRRYCETIDKTHTGKALHGCRIAEEDFWE
ncbi:uncharacterized protein B0I36DRAFT_369914 [Microdochium trichocladiopsis]|uniref:ubiquitinyl hydrolase 1 n=1 Tax=Microdochium trichocladiopsis TaxID=1682393 RepID=A0A9P8XQQ4_9PEZI|nr:uncharacterized protein B0I36DRAFT_369914 [Microdochium trichocladiopsis]KAH7012087.1 hypothetical protein B0I36DRAFT_369914 [Microdochium trichocladiopsis]